MAPFLSGSQNTSMPIQEPLPEVEIVTSNLTKRGGNFSVDEDNLLVSTWMSCMVLTKGLKIFGRKFRNTFTRTILVEPHVLLPPYQVDGEQLIGRQISSLGSWPKLKPEIKVVWLIKWRYKLYYNDVTILFSE